MKWHSDILCIIMQDVRKYHGKNQLHYMRGDFAESMRFLFTMVTWVQAASCQSLEAYTYTGVTPASSSNAAPYSKCKTTTIMSTQPSLLSSSWRKKNAAWISIPALEHQWKPVEFSIPPTASAPPHASLDEILTILLGFLPERKVLPMRCHQKHLVNLPYLLLMVQKSS